MGALDHHDSPEHREEADMSALETLERTIEAFNRHDAGAFAALHALDATAYDPQYPEPLHGRDSIRKDIEDFFVSFPDVRATVSTVLTDGDTVGCELEFSGTNHGPLVTPAGLVPATNRPVSVPGSRFVRVNEEGLVVECRRYFDMAGLIQQLGLE
jgi:steroid delta-isomerase-like uncharacterized protein